MYIYISKVYVLCEKFAFKRVIVFKKGPREMSLVTIKINRKINLKCCEIFYIVCISVENEYRRA